MEEPSDKPSKNRRSFTREFKLGVIKHYRKHGQSIHRTSDKYKIDGKHYRKHGQSIHRTSDKYKIDGKHYRKHGQSIHRTSDKYKIDGKHYRKHGQSIHRTSDKYKIDGKHYRGQSIHRTSDKYKIDRKQVRNWLKNEETIFGLHGIKLSAFCVYAPTKQSFYNTLQKFIREVTKEHPDFKLVIGTDMNATIGNDSNGSWAYLGNNNDILPTNDNGTRLLKNAISTP